MTTIASAKLATTQIETGRWIAIFDGVAVEREDGQLEEFNSEADALAHLADREGQMSNAAAKRKQVG